MGPLKLYDDEAECPCPECNPRCYHSPCRERSPVNMDGVGVRIDPDQVQEGRVKRLVYVCHP